MNRVSFAAIVAALSLLSACNKSSAPEAPPTAAPPPEVQKAVEQAPAAMPPAAETVDVCALLSKEDAEAVLGKLTAEPEPQKAQGSMLGGCNYSSDAYAVVMVSARPANEFNGTVEYSSRKAPAKEVPGVGEKAFQTESGLMLQPAGKPYFIHVYTIGKDAEKAMVELAKKLKV